MNGYRYWWVREIALYRELVAVDQGQKTPYSRMLDQGYRTRRYDPRTLQSKMGAVILPLSAVMLLQLKWR
jgi:hypothetical protein